MAALPVDAGALHDHPLDLVALSHVPTMNNVNLVAIGVAQVRAKVPFAIPRALARRSFATASRSKARSE